MGARPGSKLGMGNARDAALVLEDQETATHLQIISLD